MPLNRKTLREQCLAVLAGMVPGAPSPEDPGTATALFGSDSYLRIQPDGAKQAFTFTGDPQLPPTACMKQEVVPTFAEAVANLYSDDAIRAVMTQEEVRKRLRDLLHRLWGTQDAVPRLDEALDRLVEDMRASKRRWIAALPVQNLQLDGMKELQVGRVVFKVTEEHLGEQLYDVLAIISRSRGSRMDIGELQLKVGGMVSQHFKPYPTYALVDVDCHESLITAMAGQRVDEALSLLQSYGSVCFPDQARAYVGRVGEVTPGMRGVLGISECKQGFVVKMEAYGYLQPFLVSKDFLEHATTRLAFEDMSAILGKTPQDRTALERQVVLAILWTGTGWLQQTPAQELVHYCTAIECLIMPKGERDEKTSTFAQRLAWLTSEDAENRTAVEERARGLYHARSRVVHQGELDVQPHDVQYMRWLAVLASARMAARRSEWQNVEDLAVWARRRAMGHSSDE